MSKALAISNLITLNEVVKPYGKYLVEKIRTEIVVFYLLYHNLIDSITFNITKGEVNDTS